jgi:hypothetical protein
MEDVNPEFTLFGSFGFIGLEMLGIGCKWPKTPKYLFKTHSTIPF